VKRLIALFVGVAFVAGMSGLTAAQTPAPKVDDKTKTDTTTTDKPAEKKIFSHTANGTVKSATADGVVVSGKSKGKDTEWTFGVDTKTKIKKAGKDIMAKDLAAGDSVHVRYKENDGKALATSISVRAPKKDEAKATTTDKTATDKK
jgi:hypothetical protein